MMKDTAWFIKEKLGLKVNAEKSRAKNLIKLGAPAWTAWKASYLKRYAKPAHCGDVHIAVSNKRLADFGLTSMADYYTAGCVTCKVG